MIESRILNPGEYPTAVALWVSVFGVEKPFFQSLLDGGEPDDFSVGSFEGGRLVSSVHVFTRRFRNRNGEPQKVGGIGSVSTDPEFRGKGLSSLLLDMAIQEMEARSFVWSYLGTGVNDHYAKHGWRTVSTPYQVGQLNEAGTGTGTDRTPTPFDDPLQTEMQSLHLASTAFQPMANDRSPAMWSSGVRYRIARPEDEVFVTRTAEGLAAYLVCRSNKDGIELVEAVGEETALRGLIVESLKRAARLAIFQARCLLPPLSAGSDQFGACCLKVHSGEDRGWMARPIADRISWPDLAALLADPRGRRSDLDNF